MPKKHSTSSATAQPAPHRADSDAVVLLSSGIYNDVDRWNTMMYTEANTNHRHQDNLRWTLSAGFAAFFLASMQAVNDSKIDLPHQDTFHALQFVIVALGTIYLIVLMVEGWYYNLYLAYLIECENRMRKGARIQPFSCFNRQTVRPIHPSFFFVLMFVILANTAHLWEAVFHTQRVQVHPFWWSNMTALFYWIVWMWVAAFVGLPERVDRTLDPQRTPD